MVSLVHVYLFLCPSSPPLSPSLSLLEPDSRSLFLPSSVAYHCSTNEGGVPCKEGRKGLCDAAQLARAISQQWLSLSVSLKDVSLSFFLSASIERCDDQPTPSSNSSRSERLLWVGKEEAGCSSKRCSRCTRLGVFEARVAEIFLLPLFHSAPS